MGWLPTWTEARAGKDPDWTGSGQGWGLETGGACRLRGRLCPPRYLISSRYKPCPSHAGLRSADRRHVSMYRALMYLEPRRTSRVTPSITSQKTQWSDRPPWLGTVFLSSWREIPRRKASNISLGGLPKQVGIGRLCRGAQQTSALP